HLQPGETVRSGRIARRRRVTDRAPWANDPRQRRGQPAGGAGRPRPVVCRHRDDRRSSRRSGERPQSLTHLQAPPQRYGRVSRMLHRQPAWVGATAKEIARAVRRGDTSATAVVADHLDSIRAYDRIVGAFREVRAAAAIAEAETVDEQPELGNLAL